jgi:hypothetical protein
MVTEIPMTMMCVGCATVGKGIAVFDVNCPVHGEAYQSQLDEREANRTYPISLWDEVKRESSRATRLHIQPAYRTGPNWLAMVAEEFGEVAKEVMKGDVQLVTEREEYLRLLREELVQLASASVRWIAAIDQEARA